MPKFDDVIDLTQHELQNAVIQPLAADPSSPIEGQIYYNTTTKKLRKYIGTGWEQENTGVGDVTQASASGAANRMKVSNAADKSIKDYAGGAGIVKSDANGAVSAAVAGTDYTTAGSTESFTNKTLDANATGNSVTNLETADFAPNVIDTDTTLAANSDTRLATQKAVKAYIGSQVASLGKPQGGIDASTNPNYPAANAGDYWRITVAGKIGGASGVNVETGDIIEAFVNTAAGDHATVGGNWSILQANVDAATTTTPGLTAYATQTEANAQTVSNKAVTPAALADYPISQEFTFGDGTATSFNIDHNRGTKSVVCAVYDASTDEQRFPKIVRSTVNRVVVSGYINPPAANSMKVVVIG